jgi:hypothetical protein
MLGNKLYYPKSHIVTNLYTNGKELMLEDGTEYVGFYHRYIDNTVSTGAVPHKSNSKKLIRYVNQITQPDSLVYNTLIKKRLPEVFPTQALVIPDLDDYENGKFTRYFLRRRNYSTYEDIIEIDKPQWKLWRRQGSGINEKLYQGLELSWKLTGPLRDVPNTFNTEYGVADTNQRLVFLKDREMPGLKNYLTDYIELTIYSPYVKSDIKKLFGNLN